MFRIPLLVTIGLIANASGYGNAGHQAIGSVAEHYLEGTRAQKEVRALLKEGENLAEEVVEYAFKGIGLDD